MVTHVLFLGRVLHEVQLNESIRYATNDPVERWLYDLLCLDTANVPRVFSGYPAVSDCDLYYVNRDTLFSYHKASEAFLQRLMGLYVASHYKVKEILWNLLFKCMSYDTIMWKNPVFSLFYCSTISCSFSNSWSVSYMPLVMFNMFNINLILWAWLFIPLMITYGCIIVKPMLRTTCL